VAVKTVGEQLMDAVEARLRLITTARGYPITIGASSVRRRDRTVWQPGDLPCVSFWVASDSRVEGWGGGEHRSLELVIEVYGLVGDSDPPDVAQRLAGAVWTALLRNPTANLGTGVGPLVSDEPDPRLGGIVGAMTCESIAFDSGEGDRPYAGALLRIAITYCRDESDPYTLTAC